MRGRWRALAVTIALLSCGAAFSSRGGQTPRRIEIVARKYSFSPNEITLKKGEPVVLVLSSEDVTHGLKVKEFGIKVEVKKGHPVEIPLTPTETGHFQGKCAHFCGMGHGSMTLMINVVE